MIGHQCNIADHDDEEDKDDDEEDDDDDSVSKFNECQMFNL